MAKEYTIVKLPDGKTAKLPPEISQVEAAKILLDKLPDEQYGDFKETLRTKFNIVEETSGWGQTIGGTAGSVLGAIGGGLAGTAAGPAGTVGGGIAGSVAGGAAGGAAGEWIEQLLTGSGDDEDVIEAGAEEALWGLIPGVGGAATKTGLKAASNVANAGSKAIGTVKNIAGSAIGRGAGKGTATRAGVALPLVEVADATLKGSKGLLNKFSILPEAVRNEIMETAIKGTKEFAEKNGIRSVDDQALKYLDDALKFHVNRAYQQVHKGGAIKSGAISGVGKAYEQHQDSFAEGGEVAGWEAEAAKYADANKDVANITARDILEFVPVVGDILGAEEIYRELQKDNVNWPLVGALGGATIIGLIPGIGDAAASGIRAGARAGLKGVKGGIELAKRIEVDPNAVGSLGGNLRLRPKANDAHINDSPHSQQFEVDEAYNIPLEEEFVAPFNPSNPSQGIISDQYGNKFSTVRSNPLRQEIESSGYNPKQQVLPGFDPDTELRMIRNQMGADANRRSGLLGDTPSTTNELASATDTKQSIIAKIMGNDEVSFEEAEDISRRCIGK